MSFLVSPSDEVVAELDGAIRASRLARTIVAEHSERIEAIRQIHNSTASSLGTIYAMILSFNDTSRVAIYNHHTLTCRGCTSDEAERVAKELTDVQNELAFDTHQLINSMELSTVAWNANILLLKHRPLKGISIERLEEIETMQSCKIHAMMSEVYEFYPGIKKLLYIDSDFSLNLKAATGKFVALRECLRRHIAIIDRHVRSANELLCNLTEYIRCKDAEIDADAQDDSVAEAPDGECEALPVVEERARDGAEGEE